LLDLPEEILYLICKYLDPVSLARFSQCCHLVKGLSDDDTLWGPFYGQLLLRLKESSQQPSLCPTASLIASTRTANSPHVGTIVLVQARQVRSEGDDTNRASPSLALSPATPPLRSGAALRAQPSTHLGSRAAISQSYKTMYCSAQLHTHRIVSSYTSNLAQMLKRKERFLKKTASLLSKSKEDPHIPPAIKCVLLGDSGVGKTCTLLRYLSCPTSIQIGDEHVNMNVWDTPGGAAYLTLRLLSYPMSHVFVLMFDVCNKQSFRSIETVWHNEIVTFQPSIPFILVGNKCDHIMGASSDSAPIPTVSYQEMEQMGKRIGATFWAFTSALSSTGLNCVFEVAACAALKTLISRSRKTCSVQ